MFNTKKLFLSDIDGTILKTGKPVHPAVIDAIKGFIDKGGLFGLSSGRSPESVQDLIKTIPVNVPCILCGGAVIHDYNTNERIHTYPMENHVLSYAETVFRDYPHISITATTDKGTFNIRANRRLLDRGVREDANAPMTSLNKISNPLKLLFTCDDIASLKEIESLFLSADLYTFKFASTYFCEVSAKGADKGTAASFLRDRIGECRLFTAGDSGSDLEMASVSELFLAPETAMEAVRARADFVFPAPLDGGFTAAIDYIQQLP